ncbi:MAG: molybdenum cofactor guanylyltransferase [Armatimonadota bacterium]|nr:molybdenum cofactor guanylyltransferase [Armatimonadota bacterium]
MVLAGGRSRRMGLDKATLRLGAESLLARVVRRLAMVCRPVVVVAAHAGPHLDCPAPIVPDRWPGAGPLGGLATGLRALAGPGGHETARVVLVGVDMPFVVPALLEYLLTRTPAWDAVVPLVRGQAQPLCAVYGTPVAATAEELLRQGRQAMHDLLAAPGLRVAYVPEGVLRAYDPDLRSFFNVNTPEDLVRAQELAAAETDA